MEPHHIALDKAIDVFVDGQKRLREDDLEKVEEGIDLIENAIQIMEKYVLGKNNAPEPESERRSEQYAAEMCHWLGRGKMKVKDYSGAVSALEKAIKYDREEPLVYIQLGLVHLLNENPEDALRCCEAGMEFARNNPNYSALWYYAAKSCFALNEKEKAKGYFEHFLPTLDERRHWVQRLVKQEILFSLREYKKLIKVFEDTESEDTTFEEYFIAGIAFFRLFENKKASACFQKCILDYRAETSLIICPTLDIRMDALFFQGLVFIKDNNFDAAKESLQILETEFPDSLRRKILGRVMDKREISQDDAKSIECIQEEIQEEIQEKVNTRETLFISDDSSVSSDSSTVVSRPRSRSLSDACSDDQSFKEFFSSTDSSPPSNPRSIRYHESIVVADASPDKEHQPCSSSKSGNVYDKTSSSPTLDWTKNAIDAFSLEEEHQELLELSTSQISSLNVFTNQERKSDRLDLVCGLLESHEQVMQYSELVFVGRYALSDDRFPAYPFSIDTPVLVILWSTRFRGREIPSREEFQCIVCNSLKETALCQDISIVEDRLIRFFTHDAEQPQYCILYDMNNVENNFDCAAPTSWIDFDASVSATWKEWKEEQFEETAQTWIANVPTVVSVHVPIQDDFPVVRIYTLCKDWIPVATTPLLLPTFEQRALGILGTCEGAFNLASDPVQLTYKISNDRFVRSFFYPPAFGLSQNKDRSFSSADTNRVCVGHAVLFDDMYSYGTYLMDDQDPEAYKEEHCIKYCSLTCFLDEHFRITYTRENARFAVCSGHSLCLRKEVFVSVGKIGSGPFLEYNSEEKHHELHFEELDSKLLGIVVGTFLEVKDERCNNETICREFDMAVVCLDPNILPFICPEDTPFSSVSEQMTLTANSPVQVRFTGASWGRSKGQCQIVERAILRINGKRHECKSKSVLVICGRFDWAHFGDSGSPVYGYEDDFLYAMMVATLYHPSHYEQKCYVCEEFLMHLDDSRYYPDDVVYISFACDIRKCFEEIQTSSSEIWKNVNQYCRHFLLPVSEEQGVSSSTSFTTIIEDTIAPAALMSSAEYKSRMGS